jgi:hypothetical protein
MKRLQRARNRDLRAFGHFERPERLPLPGTDKKRLFGTGSPGLQSAIEEMLTPVHIPHYQGSSLQQQPVPLCLRPVVARFSKFEVSAKYRIVKRECRSVKHLR